MRYFLLLLVLLGACNGCQQTPVATSPSDQAIATQLIEAGCLANDDTAVPAVHAERALNPPVAWMNCLSSSGSVAGCQVPCSK